MTWSGWFLYTVEKKIPNAISLIHLETWEEEVGFMWYIVVQMSQPQINYTLVELKKVAEPTSLASDHLRALWYDLHGNWDTAHRIVQQMDDFHAMWIHAYLHRKEPDEWNARYWYGRCGKPFAGMMSFSEEAATILNDLEQHSLR
jgi:hypothetical protein